MTIEQHIYAVLKDELQVTTLANFHREARLNEDLWLDSVLFLQLVIHLEARLGLQLPDEELHAKDFATVQTLVQFLEGHYAAH